jgi:hypothetical protein
MKMDIKATANRRQISKLKLKLYKFGKINSSSLECKIHLLNPINFM